MKTIYNNYGISLFSIGIVTGIVLCILQGIGTINIGWFWATFPFWIVPAVGITVTLIIVLIALIFAAFDK